MSDKLIPILPRPGDVLPETGNIVAGPAAVVTHGRVAIDPSRVRRAERFGWISMGPSKDHGGLVIVERAMGVKTNGRT